MAHPDRWTPGARPLSLLLADPPAISGPPAPVSPAPVGSTHAKKRYRGLVALTALTVVLVCAGVGGFLLLRASGMMAGPRNPALSFSLPSMPRFGTPAARPSAHPAAHPAARPRRKTAHSAATATPGLTDKVTPTRKTHRGFVSRPAIDGAAVQVKLTVRGGAGPARSRGSSRSGTTAPSRSRAGRSPFRCPRTSSCRWRTPASSPAMASCCSNRSTPPRWCRRTAGR